MTKTQRYKYEMLVRVRDYGVAHREGFPESSPGGERFAQVTAAVAEIDRHLKNHALGAAEARRVKATTRAAVVGYMKAIAQAARRVTRSESGQTPFRMPQRRNLKAEISAARLFIDEAAQRQQQFIGLGMPSTFISDFTTLVDELQKAVDTRLSSKTVRRGARTGVVASIAIGFDAVKDLDVAVAMAARENPVLAGAWAAARRIEGRSRPSADVATPVNGAAGQPATDVPEAAPAATDTSSSPPVAIAPVPIAMDMVGRAS